MPEVSQIKINGKLYSFADLEARERIQVYTCTLNEDLSINTIDLAYSDCVTAEEAQKQVLIIGIEQTGCTLVFRDLGKHLENGEATYLFKTSFDHATDSHIREIIIRVPQNGVAFTSIYTYENEDNKVSSWNSELSDESYPTEKLVKTTLDEKASAAELEKTNTQHTSDIERLNRRIDSISGAIAFFSLSLNDKEPYVNPETMKYQIKENDAWVDYDGDAKPDETQYTVRHYLKADITIDDGYNEDLMDIVAKSWLQKEFGFTTIEQLDNASIYFSDIERTGGPDSVRVDYWRNLANTEIGDYPLLQQTGCYKTSSSSDVAPFTSTSQGTIIGTTVDGQIGSLGGGIGVVNGWDTIKSDIEELQNSAVEGATEKPLMDSTIAAVGTSTKFAREDHTHPKDSTKENVSNKITSWNKYSSDVSYPSEKLVKAALDEKETKENSKVHLYFAESKRTFSTLGNAALGDKVYIRKKDTNNYYEGYVAYKQADTTLVMLTTSPFGNSIPYVYVEADKKKGYIDSGPDKAFTTETFTLNSQTYNGFYSYISTTIQNYLVENTIKVNKYVSNNSGEIVTISRKIYLPSSQELGGTKTDVQDTDYVFTNKLTDQRYITRTCLPLETTPLIGDKYWAWWPRLVEIENGKITETSGLWGSTILDKVPCPVMCFSNSTPLRSDGFLADYPDEVSISVSMLTNDQGDKISLLDSDWRKRLSNSIYDSTLNYPTCAAVYNLKTTLESSKEDTANKVTSISGSETFAQKNTLFPTVGASLNYFYRKPDVLSTSSYDPQQSTVGEASATISGLTLSPYRFLRAYIGGFNGGTSSSYGNTNLIVDIDLGSNASRNGYYTGGAATTAYDPGQSRIFAVCSAQINGAGNDNFYFNWLVRYQSQTPANLSGSGRQLYRLEGWY